MKRLIYYILIAAMNLLIIYSYNPALASENTQWAFVDQSKPGSFPTIESALAAGAKNIFIKNGTYEISDALTISNTYTVIRGESKEGVRIIQTNNARDLIRINASYVTISNLTLDTVTHNVNGCAIICSNASNVIIDNNIINGSSLQPSVYISGKTTYANDAEIFDAIENTNSNMVSNNVFKNNTINTSFTGDVVFFGLQNNGLITHNTITGGRLSFYMCANSQCLSNTVIDSCSVGIYCYIPAKNNFISDNIVRNSTYVGIKVQPQLDHPVDGNYRATELTIQNNLIEDSRIYGIEVYQVSNSVIRTNNVVRPDYYGIYLYKVDNTVVQNNKIDDYNKQAERGFVIDLADKAGKGIIAEDFINNVKIVRNVLINRNGEIGIRLPDTINNTNNKVMGNKIYTYRAITGISVQPSCEEHDNLTIMLQEGDVPENKIAGQWMVVDQSGNGDYTTIQDAVAAGEKNIYIKNGTYDFTGDIRINTPYTIIRGESKEGVRIVQHTPGQVIFAAYADGVTIANLTLDTQLYNTNSAYVTANSDYVTLEDCSILGPDNAFTIYFAGPDFPDSNTLLDWVISQPTNLDSYNIIRNNTIDGHFWGDMIAFCCQYKSLITNNTITGGRIAYYMNDNSACTNNTIGNSESNGIAIAVPCYNNLISNNIITNTKASGIWSTEQGEHHYTPLEPAHSFRGVNCTIVNNIVTDSKFFGIELDQLQDSIVTNNKVDTADYYGIYIIRSENIIIEDNTVEDYYKKEVRGSINAWGDTVARGIYGELSLTDCSFVKNTVINKNGINNGANGIIVPNGNGNAGNKILGNKIYSYVPITGVVTSGENTENTVVNLEEGDIPANEIEEQWKLVGNDLSKNYQTIQDALVGSEKNIFIKNGTYEISTLLSLSSPYTTIRGESKDGTVIVQTNTASSIFGIYADYISISNFTLDMQTNNTNTTAIYCRDSSHVIIENNIINGSPNSTAILFEGKTTYADINAKIVAVETNNSNMDSYNVIKNNIITANLPDADMDLVSFNVQNHGLVSNNTITGGRLSAFMCVNSEIMGNTISDSFRHGIIYTMPAKNNLIEGNIISDTKYSSIIIWNPINDTHYENLTVENNTITDSRFMGIEIQELKDSLIRNNSITRPDHNGIYVFYSDNLVIMKNTIDDYTEWEARGSYHAWPDGDGEGIFLEDFGPQQVTNTKVVRNIFKNSHGDYGIKISGADHNNKAWGNKIYSYIPVTAVFTAGESSDNLVVNLQPEDVPEDKILGQWVVVDGSGSGDYITVEAALAANEKNIYIKNGTYNVSDNLTINTPYTTIRGESKNGVIIVQNNPGNDLFQLYADGIWLSNMTLDTEEFSAQGTVVNGNSSYSIVENCIINGSDDTFTIFYAGKTYTDDVELLDAIENTNTNMDSYNIIKGCTVNSNWNGDVFAFGTQNRGLLYNNIVNGGRIAFYMNVNSECLNNSINNSATEGISYSTPAKNNIIANNTVQNSNASGLRVLTQGEHPVPGTYRPTGLIFENNTINDTRYFGIGIDQLKDSIIRNNTITSPDYTGVYMYRVDDTIIENNRIEYYNMQAARGHVNDWGDVLGRAIYAEDYIVNVQFIRNTLINKYGGQGIRLNNTANNSGNKVLNNIVFSSTAIEGYSLQAGCEDTENKTVTLFYASTPTITDTANNGDGRDIKVTFAGAQDESNISGYRIYCVPSANASSFFEPAALALTSSKYVFEPKSGNGDQHNIILSQTLQDSTGNVINSGSIYKVIILAAGLYDSPSTLSSPSADLQLLPTVPQVEQASTPIVYDIANTGDARDIRVEFNGVSNESNVDSYRIFVVPVLQTGSFNIPTANGLDSTRYVSVAKSGNGTQYSVVLTQDLKDTAGNSISDLNTYRLLVLTVGANTYYNNLSDGSSEFRMRSDIPRQSSSDYKDKKKSDNNDRIQEMEAKIAKITESLDSTQDKLANQKINSLITNYVTLENLNLFDGSKTTDVIINKKVMDNKLEEIGILKSALVNRLPNSNIESFGLDRVIINVNPKREKIRVYVPLESLLSSKEVSIIEINNIKIPLQSIDYGQFNNNLEASLLVEITDRTNALLSSQNILAYTGEKRIPLKSKVLHAFTINMYILKDNKKVKINKLNDTIVVSIDVSDNLTPLEKQKLIVYSGNGKFIGGNYDCKTNKFVLTTKEQGLYKVVKEDITFKDTADSQFRDFIEILAAKRIISGTTNEKFEPKMKLTRAHVAVLIQRILNLDDKTYNRGYSDVKEQDWYYKAVETVSGTGIISSVHGNKFEPLEEVTFEEFIAIIMKVYYYSTTQQQDITRGIDKSKQPSKYYKAMISDVYNKGIIDKNEKVYPKRKVTREEVSKILVNLIQEIQSR